MSSTFRNVYGLRLNAVLPLLCVVGLATLQSFRATGKGHLPCLSPTCAVILRTSFALISLPLHVFSMFVFGGFDGNIRLNDLHAFCYETRTWSEIRAGGHAPSPRAYHSAVTYEGSMYIFGGFDGNHRYNELYRYHFGTLRVA